MRPKSYSAVPAANGLSSSVAVKRRDGSTVELEVRNDLDDFGVSTFSWGADEVGRNALALALVADAMDDQTALLTFERVADVLLKFMRSDRGWDLCENTVAAIAQSAAESVQRRAA